MRINLKKVVCNLIVFFPPIYLGANAISDGFARKLVILFLLLLFICVCARRKRSDVLFGVVIALLVFTSFIKFGISYVIHLDFYGFIFLLLIMQVFSCDDYICELRSCIYAPKKANRSMALFYGILLLSIFFGNGVRYSDSWGVSIPMLWGPFDLPHMLAYMQIVMFCFAGMLFRYNGKKYYLIAMAVACICTMWTGVRSAFLVLFIVAVTEYLAIKSVPKKTIVMLAGLLVLTYLTFFTDVIVSNPIVQKTLSALSKGSISNSRDDFNSYLMTLYCNQVSSIDKIIGIGLSELRRLMSLRYGTALHAHNDFLNILLGMGIIGFLAFGVVMIKFCKKCRKWWIPLLVFSTLAFTNGLYMYTGFVVCMPVVLLYYISIYGCKHEMTLMFGSSKFSGAYGKQNENIMDLNGGVNEQVYICNYHIQPRENGT